MERAGRPRAARLNRVPLLERAGLAYLGRLARGRTLPPAADPVHVLNPDEQRELRRVERGAIARAALAGAVSALCGVGIVTWVARLRGAEPEPLGDAAQFAAWTLAMTWVAAICALEIAYVYRDALRSVHALSRAAGLDPLAAEPVASALVRAALELPCDTRPAHGVDPGRESSRLQVVLASLLYKAKIALTTVLLKVAVRRVLGRAVVRVALELVAVPVAAAWNGWVAWRVMREARVRAMGPSFAREVAAALAGLDPAPLARDAARRAVACAIVRTRELHPNQAALLAELGGGEAGPPAVDDPAALLAALPPLPEAGRRQALALLAAASVIDGRLTRGERRLWRDACAASGLSATHEDLDELRDAFVEGRPRLPAALRAARA